MAKVLLLFHQVVINKEKPDDIVCFYESFAKELNRFSNEVKCVNTLFIKNYFDEKITSLNPFKKQEFINDLKEFNPDIIFTFNNQITEEIITNTNCPICIMDADSIDLFANKHFIKQYSDRYYLFSFAQNWEKDKYPALGLNKKNIGFLHLATAIKNENFEKTTNISFIGTKFKSLDRFVINQLQTQKDAYEDICTYLKDQYKESDKIIEKYKKLHDFSIPFNMHSLMDTRLIVLESIFDLGLKIYGVDWDKLPPELFILKLCFDKTPKYTLQHNQDIYNSSKINISISHSQCKGYAFPWRVYDIMASNGLLISSYAKLLEEKTKGIVEIPMYKSPHDARDLCKYALENPSYCEDIVAASNEFIEKYGRWKSNFEIIQSTVGINILNAEIAPPPMEKSNCYSNLTNLTYKEKRTLPVKNRVKNIINGFSLALSQLPLIDSFYTDKVNYKLYYSIKKYEKGI